MGFVENVKNLKCRNSKSRKPKSRKPKNQKIKIQNFESEAYINHRTPNQLNKPK